MWAPQPGTGLPCLLGCAFVVCLCWNVSVPEPCLAAENALVVQAISGCWDCSRGQDPQSH